MTHRIKFRQFEINIFFFKLFLDKFVGFVCSLLLRMTNLNFRALFTGKIQSDEKSADPMLPCEFCDGLVPMRKLLEHQVQKILLKPVSLFSSFCVPRAFALASKASAFLTRKDYSLKNTFRRRKERVAKNGCFLSLLARLGFYPLLLCRPIAHT